MKHLQFSILCSLLVPSAAIAQDTSSSWMLCTSNLELHETIIVRADEQQVVTVDRFGIRHNWSTGDLFFASPANTASNQNTDLTLGIDSTDKRFITFVDGQVITGSLNISSDPDHMSYTILTGSIQRGAASIPLEQVYIVSNSPPKKAAVGIADADSITTSTGDTITGFIEAIGPATTIVTDRNTIHLDLDQIELISLANIPERVEGMYISTNDNLHLRVSTFDFDFQYPLTVRLDSQSIGLAQDDRDIWLLDPDSAIGITILHPSKRVVSLASITPELIEPTGDRSWTPTPTVIQNAANPVLSSIDLHAPVRAVYPLPQGSTRFACELDAAISTWTDCIAEVFAISYTGLRTELLRVQLNADHPSQTMNSELPKGTEKIELRIDPGSHGPIQDRVIIKYPRVLIES